MKRFWISMIGAVMLMVAVLAPAAAQEVLTLDLDEVDESGISGTVRLVAENGQTTVAILITAGLEDGAVHPVHIHDGTCDDLGGVAYPLDDIVDGSSETTLDVALAELLTGEFAINAHMSADDMATWVACANIPENDLDEVDDDEVADDADDEMVEEEDDDDAVEDVVPAAGSTGGVSTDTAAMMIVLLAGVMLGTGVLVRRRSEAAFRS